MARLSFGKSHFPLERRKLIFENLVVMFVLWIGGFLTNGNHQLLYIVV